MHRLISGANSTYHLEVAPSYSLGIGFSCIIILLGGIPLQDIATHVHPPTSKNVC